MSGTVELEAARRTFLSTGLAAGPVRPEVVASWERCRRSGVDPERGEPGFHGFGSTPLIVGCAEEVFDEFCAGTGGPFALMLVDAAGVVRIRRDGDPALAMLLDALLIVPGYGFGEAVVGTTAAGLALHDQADAVVAGPEHFSSRLACLAEAAALAVDPLTHEVAGAVVVLGPEAAGGALQPQVARMLAQAVTERMAGEPHRRAQVLLERFRTVVAEWVLATDGDGLLSNAGARHLDGADLRVIGDLALASLAVQDFSVTHLDLPSGRCAEVATEPVHLRGELVGCVLSGGPAGAAQPVEPAEAVRRQGSHVAPTVRRDFAADLRTARPAHVAAQVRANRELLTPYLRARNEVAARVGQGRNHLLIGEPGVGKRTLLLGQFRRAYPQGRVVTVDGEQFAAEPGNSRTDPAARLLAGLDDRQQLLVLHGIHALNPVAARRLDETLRQLAALPAPPLVVACLDSPAVDASRPYGLLLRHFHEYTRVPALRYRADEIGDIALAVLRRVAGRRALRLSLQAVRVLEGYAWPGNISELEDVLRYVVARKPLGEVQPPDLPPLCFQGGVRKLSMLEAAQCDAIIQALYESRGNRYRAAAMLGIARSSLYRKIDAFGISYIA